MICFKSSPARAVIGRNFFTDSIIEKKILLISNFDLILIYVSFNPLALRLSLESIVCFSHIFKNNFWIKRKFKKTLRESCCLASDKHFSFKCFQENAFVSKIYSKSSGLFWPL